MVNPQHRDPSTAASASPRSTGITRKRACDAQQTREAGSDALPLDLALELLDGLLGTRPVGMHFEQLLEGLECRLFLADLAQDLGKPIERLEMMGVERERASQIAQRALDVVLHEVHIGAPVPAFGEVGRQLDEDRKSTRLNSSHL